MAKRVSERATRGGEHGGVGTPHARGASGEALGVGSDEASSISFCLRARWLVSSLTRRCGGPPAHLPSGRGPGCGFASDRAIPPPSQAGVGFGLWLGSPVWFCCSLWQREIKLRRNKGPTAGGVVVDPGSGSQCVCQSELARASLAVRRSAFFWRWLPRGNDGGGVSQQPSCSRHSGSLRQRGVRTC